MTKSAVRRRKSFVATPREHGVVRLVHEGHGSFRLWAVVLISLAVFLTAAVLLRDDMSARQQHLLHLAKEASQLRTEFERNPLSHYERRLLTIAHDENHVNAGYYALFAPIVYGHDYQKAVAQLRHDVLWVLAAGIAEQLRTNFNEFLNVPHETFTQREILTEFKTLEQLHDHWRGFLALDIKELGVLVYHYYALPLPASWFDSETHFFHSIASSHAPLEQDMHRKVLRHAQSWIENLASHQSGRAQALTWLGLINNEATQLHTFMTHDAILKNKILASHLQKVKEDLRSLKDWTHESAIQQKKADDMMEDYLSYVASSSFFAEDDFVLLRDYYEQKTQELERLLVRPSFLLSAPVLVAQGEGFMLHEEAQNSLTSLESLFARMDMGGYDPMPALKRASLSSIHVKWDREKLKEALHRARLLEQKLTKSLQKSSKGMIPFLARAAFGSVITSLERDVGNAWSYKGREHPFVLQNALADNMEATHDIAHILAFEESARHQLESYGGNFGVPESFLAWLMTTWSYRHIEYAFSRLAQSDIFLLPPAMDLQDGSLLHIQANFASHGTLEGWLMAQKKDLKKWLSMVEPYVQLLALGDEDMTSSAIVKDFKKMRAVFRQDEQSLSDIEQFILRAQDESYHSVCDAWFPFAPIPKEARSFLDRRTQLMRQRLYELCRKEDFYHDATARYHSLALSFNREMAGRYPFAPLDAPDHTLLDVYSFLTRWSVEIDTLYRDFAKTQDAHFRDALTFLAGMMRAREIIHKVAPISSLPVHLRFDIGQLNQFQFQFADDEPFKALYVMSGNTHLSLAQGSGNIEWVAGDGIQLSLAWGKQALEKQESIETSTAWYESVIHQKHLEQQESLYAVHGAWGLLRLIERYGVLSQQGDMDALLRLPFEEDGKSLDLLVRLDIERGGRAFALNVGEGVPFAYRAPFLEVKNETISSQVP